jgi:peptide/nickel transport system substrate-binding protein
MRRSSLFVAIVAASCLVASACSGSGSGTGTTGSSGGGTFTMSQLDDTDGMDPYRDGTGLYLVGLAYDSLLNLRPDGTFVSGLADKWSADARTATFTLRQGVTCSDGTPLTASQVAADMSFVGNEKNASALYGRFTPPLPFRATGDDGTGTVTVTMTGKPFGFLLHTLGLLPIVCPKGLKDPKALERATDGTGPYVLSEAEPGQRYTFTARKDYAWGPDGATTTGQPGSPHTIVVRVITNETTAANLLLSGELNMAQVIGQDRSRLQAKGFKALEVPQAGAWLFFNHRGGRPNSDELVRRALVQSLDLDEVVKVSTLQTGRAATGLTALEPKACADDSPALGDLPGHDAAAAGTQLDQAGWVKGPDGKRSKDGKPLAIDLYYVPAFLPGGKPAAELIAQQWESLGATVKTTAGTLTGLVQVQKNGNYDVLLQPFNSSLPSRFVSLMSGPTPPDGNNFSGIDNRAYTDLVTKASAITAPESCTYWKQAEQALFRAVDVAPISERIGYYFLNGADATMNGTTTLPDPTSIRVHE